MLSSDQKTREKQIRAIGACLERLGRSKNAGTLAIRVLTRATPQNALERLTDAFYVECICVDRIGSRRVAEQVIEAVTKL